MKKFFFVFLLFLQGCINVGEEIKETSNIFLQKDKCIIRQNISGSSFSSEIICSEKYKIKIVEDYDKQTCTIDRYLFKQNRYPLVKFSLVCKDFTNQGFVNVY